ncbi:DMT family transporter [Polyangium sp. 15x6]|nr:DMT family transporter [Polyangium sp. 15x6]
MSLLSTLLFATQFPLIRLSLDYVTAPLAAIYEAGFTLLFCLVGARLLGPRARVVMSGGLLASGLLNAIGLIFLFESLSRIHPGIVGLVGRLYFVYAMMIAYVYFQERPSKLELLLVVAALIGVFLVSFQGTVGPMGSMVGFLLAALYPAAFAIQNAVVKSTLEREGPLTILLNTKLYALTPLVLYAIAREGVSSLRYAPEGVAILLCSTFLATFLGLALFYRAMAITTFGTANLMKAAEPVFVLLFSAFLFPIQVSPQLVCGTTLIVFSVCAAAFMRS